MYKQLSIRATRFFQRVIKEYKAGHATGASLGAYNRRITLNNGRKIVSYRGSHVPELMHRINHYMERH